MSLSHKTKHGQADLISAAVGSPYFQQPWYPADLSAQVLGHRAKEPLRISRFYFEAKVAVDFEPDPRDERFYLDEKKRWCVEQGIAYVPIFLADHLSPDQFAVRLREARMALTEDRTALRDRTTLDASEPSVQMLLQPDIALYVDREALARLEAGLAEGKHWYGSARQHRLAFFKRAVVAEILEKYPRGNVGPEYRASVAPHAAGG